MNSSLMKDLLLKGPMLSGGSRIWYTSLEAHDSKDYLSFLSTDELERASRLKNEKLSQKTVISRGLLRMILGRTLKINPASVVFEKNAHGRLVLAGNKKHRLDFSVAHSKNILVVALSETSQIGIDIEWIDPNINFQQVALIAFTPEELRFFVAQENRPYSFFHVWTAKEAVLKATGLGFSYPINRFSVISSESEEIATWISGEVTHGKRCVLNRFDLPGHFGGTLAEICQ